ncbi:hypothetical protein GCM10017620_12830 [Brevundimonas intermedia]|uniref:Uncharacterized protein n=1 Tax=Brevundimonas intermedia TaxID=74315 RepID=A0ABQ5T6A6_9CAUL|nr:hypothetical protein GCM10017620_12830 [Brevundimonas intermedia]
MSGRKTDSRVPYDGGIALGIIHSGGASTTGLTGALYGAIIYDQTWLKVTVSRDFLDITSSERCLSLLPV